MEVFAPWLTPALLIALVAWLRSELVSRTDKLEKRFDGVDTGFDAVTDEELKTSPVYNVALRNGHAQNSLNVRLDGPNGSGIVWTIDDPVDANGWSSAQTGLIRNLLPHIRQYVSVRQALAGAGALGASLAGMLDTTGSSIIQLDGRGRIVAASDGARDVLRTGDGLFDKGGACTPGRRRTTPISRDC